MAVPLIETLAPQMLAYSKQFHTDGDVEWSPYVMFFHPKRYSSAVVNTDSSGFRFSELDGNKYSVANGKELSSARLIAGNSVAFGIGASSDKATIASRLMAHDSRPEPWLNFSGRAFNSAQELILLTLNRHMLPNIDEIVLFSGANDLLLSSLPERYRQEHGAFFNCQRFFETFEGSGNTAKKKRLLSGVLGRGEPTSPPDAVRPVDERIDYAAELTLRHLDGWNAVAKDMGARLTFVLQPMSGWVRNASCQEEKALFADLASLRRFTTIRQDILQADVCDAYASKLEAGTRTKGISFVNSSLVLRKTAKDDQWLFIDHTHLTDDAYDLTAKLILDATQRQTS